MARAALPSARVFVIVECSPDWEAWPDWASEPLGPEGWE